MSSEHGATDNVEEQKEDGTRLTTPSPLTLRIRLILESFDPSVVKTNPGPGQKLGN